MGLFDGGQKRENARSELKAKLSKHRIIPALVDAFAKKFDQNPWIISAQGYYDSCDREIVVGPDEISIIIPVYKDVQERDANRQIITRSVKEAANSVGYAFTQCGYVPLHSYTSEAERTTIPLFTVCATFLDIFVEGLRSSMPDCKFDSVRTSGDTACISYKVPPVQLRDWF